VERDGALRRAARAFEVPVSIRAGERRGPRHPQAGAFVMRPTGSFVYPRPGGIVLPDATAPVQVTNLKSNINVSNKHTGYRWDGCNLQLILPQCRCCGARNTDTPQAAGKFCL